MNLAYVAATELQTAVNRFSTTTVIIGVLLVLGLIALSFMFTRGNAAKRAAIKKQLFIAISIVVITTTIVITGATFFLNSQSYTKGAINWRADVEFWACGNELELRDPASTFTNRIGSPNLHEHNDKRIHAEGVPLTSEDTTLGQFMHAVGGAVTKDTLVVPLNKAKYYETAPGEEDGDGYGAPASEEVEPYISSERGGALATFINGQSCGTQKAEVQVFVYRFDPLNQTYRQTKLSVPQDYTITNQANVPPGDCIIFEFAAPMARTTKLCKSYGQRDITRCQSFGVPADKLSRCTYKEAI